MQNVDNMLYTLEFLVVSSEEQYIAVKNLLLPSVKGIIMVALDFSNSYNITLIKIIVL